MSRILEREGVWNYVASGALSITFPPGSGFEPFSFPAFNVQCGKAIDCSYHWVVAPPFQIIDIAIQACRYPYPFNHLLPKIVWEPGGDPATGELSDFFGGNALKEIARTGMTLDEALDHYLPNYRGGFCARLSAAGHHAAGHAVEVRADQRGGGREFAGAIHRLQSRGLTAAQIYARKIRPRLTPPQQM